MSKIELKPCPFCGSNKIESRTEGGSDERMGYNFIHTISCQKCGCRNGVGSARDKNGWCTDSTEKVIAKAVEKWNKRATLSPDQPDDCASSRTLLLTDVQFEQFQKLLNDHPMDENQSLQDLLAMKSRWSKP